MHGHRDIIAESEIVQSVDGKEDEDIRKPANEGDGAGFEEERLVGEGRGKEELNKGYKQA